jgi:hypothetical protein
MQREEARSGEGKERETYIVPDDLHVGLAKMKERAEGREGDGVHQVASVIKHCNIHSHRPHLLSGHDAQRLGLYRPTFLERPFQDALHLDTEWGRPSRVERS